MTGHDLLEAMPAAARATVDLASIGVFFATLSDVMPGIAGVFTVAWCSLRIWESRTVQGWRGRRVAEDTSSD